MEKLEAINTCVEALGFPPLMSDTQLANNLAGNKASLLIDKTSRSVLSKGYWFNEEIYQFSTDAFGKVDLPSDTLAIKPWGDNKFDTLIKRSGSLYNTETHSFDVSDVADSDGNVTILVIKELSFADLPEPAADHVVAKAVRITVQDATGDQNDIVNRSREEQRTKMLLKVEDGSQKKYSAFTCNRRLARAASLIGGDNAVHRWTGIGGGRGILKR